MQTEFARAQMITQQVRAWDVLDQRVLDAMRRTPREFFVPERYQGLAFADADIPLAPGQHMLPQIAACACHQNSHDWMIKRGTATTICAPQLRV